MDLMDLVNVQMQQLMEQAQLTDAEKKVREMVREHLQDFFSIYLPGSRLVALGSSVNSFGVHSCELDMTLNLEQTQSYQGQRPAAVRLSNPVQQATEGPPDDDAVLQSDVDVSAASPAVLLELVAAILRRRVPGVHRVQVVCVSSTRCSVIKFHHQQRNVHGVITINDRLAVRNTQFLQLCSQLDARIRPLVYTVHHWAQSQGLAVVPGSARVPGLLSSYALNLLVIFFLQNTHPPILPSLDQLRDMSCKEERCEIDGWDCTFPSQTPAVPPSQNSKDLCTLLSGFFSFYGSFMYRSRVISPREGRAILGRQDDPKRPPLVLLDPFDCSHNVAADLSDNGQTRFQRKCMMAGQFCQSLKYQQSVEGGAWGLAGLLSSVTGERAKRNKKLIVAEPSMIHTKARSCVYWLPIHYIETTGGTSYLVSPLKPDGGRNEFAEQVSVEHADVVALQEEVSLERRVLDVGDLEILTRSPPPLRFQQRGRKAKADLPAVVTETREEEAAIALPARPRRGQEGKRKRDVLPSSAAPPESAHDVQDGTRRSKEMQPKRVRRDKRMAAEVEDKGGHAQEEKSVNSPSTGASHPTALEMPTLPKKRGRKSKLPLLPGAVQIPEAHQEAVVAAAPAAKRSRRKATAEIMAPAVPPESRIRDVPLVTKATIKRVTTRARVGGVVVEAENQDIIVPAAKTRRRGRKSSGPPDLPDEVPQKTLPTRRVVAVEAQPACSSTVGEEKQVPAPLPRTTKRGRPRKAELPQGEMAAVPKRRGRPRKVDLPQSEQKMAVIPTPTLRTEQNRTLVPPTEASEKVKTQRVRATKTRAPPKELKEPKAEEQTPASSSAVEKMDLPVVRAMPVDAEAIRLSTVSEQMQLPAAPLPGPKRSGRSKKADVPQQKTSVIQAPMVSKGQKKTLAPPTEASEKLQTQRGVKATKTRAPPKELKEPKAEEQTPASTSSSAVEKMDLPVVRGRGGRMHGKRPTPDMAAEKPPTRGSRAKTRKTAKELDEPEPPPPVQEHAAQSASTESPVVHSGTTRSKGKGKRCGTKAVDDDTGLKGTTGEQSSSVALAQKPRGGMRGRKQDMESPGPPQCSFTPLQKTMVSPGPPQCSFTPLQKTMESPGPPQCSSTPLQKTMGRGGKARPSRAVPEPPGENPRRGGRKKTTADHLMDLM